MTTARLPLLSLALVIGCSGSDSPPLPDQVEVPVPEKPIENVELVEDFSEEIADWLLDLSDKLRRRDFEQALEWFAEDFAGHSWSDLPTEREEERRLGASLWIARTSHPGIVDRAGLLASIEGHIGHWNRVEEVLWKTKGASFEARARPQWGRIKVKVTMSGERIDGGRETVHAGLYLLVTKRKGRRWIDALQLDSLDVERVDEPFFTEVSAAAGVAHRGIRFGQPGNQSFAWNGAASGDVNGDGAFDVFLPSDGRNFLYLSTPGGGFVEDAEARGVGQPAAGTGPVFFDFDNDGDQDLAVAHEGYFGPGDRLSGSGIRLYENDGAGHFEDISSSTGIDEPVGPYYSLTVFDFDGDGWLDLYACAYGIIVQEHNDSWLEATNGYPNRLFRNLEGKGFRDVAAEAGIAGAQWSYAAAVADYDADGDLDLYVANDYGSNNLFQNDGQGRFVDVAADLGVVDRGNGMGAAWGDLDNDGHLDLYVSNMSSSAGNRILGRLEGSLDQEVFSSLRKLAAGNTVFLSGGDERFGLQPASAGGVGASWAWTAVLCDFDLDGWLDVFCTNGYVTGDLAHDT